LTLDKIVNVMAISELIAKDIEHVGIL
jgi:hypothetical protein